MIYTDEKCQEPHIYIKQISNTIEGMNLSTIPEFHILHGHLEE